MMKVSHHAKQRARERIDGPTTKYQKSQLFTKALQKGIPAKMYSGPFREYLNNKLCHTKGVNIKVYKNNIYVYNNKVVLTVFPVPQMYLPVDDYLASFLDNNPNLARLYSLVPRQEVSFELVLTEKENLIFGLYINNEFKAFGSGKNVSESKTNAVKTYLKLLDGGKYEVNK